MKPTPQSLTYLRDRVLSASPEELRLLLLEGALRFARQGLTGLEEGDHEKSFSGISQCQDIILELINALRPEVSPDLCRNLAALYTYIYRQSIEALRSRDTAILQEVLSLLEYERESWLLVMEQLRKERSESKGATSLDSQIEGAMGSAPSSTISLSG